MKCKNSEDEKILSVWEKEGIDKKNTDSQRQNNKGECEQEEDRLQEKVEEAEQDHHHDQGAYGIVGDARYDVGARQDPESQEKPGMDETRERIWHYQEL